MEELIVKKLTNSPVFHANRYSQDTYRVKF